MSINTDQTLLLACCAFGFGKWGTGIFFISYMSSNPGQCFQFFLKIQLLHIYDSVVYVY